jgi:spermidine synthase
MTDRKDATLLAFVFGATLFMSASLMFSIQPMIGKMLLPIVGGSPAGWIVAMAFFQIMLLAGYFLAHFFSTVKPSAHGALFLLALCLGFAFLPAAIHPPADGVPGPFDVFAMLFRAVAMPFVALSAASSTLQRLFTQTQHPRAQDPYFLYAVSNLGSFAGLFAYPFLIDPLTGLKLQGHLWLGGYALLVLFVAASLWFALRGKAATSKKAAETREAAPTLKQKLHWVALSFFPSSLLLGVTMYITSNIFPAPMMWVIPLGLYLLTFIIAFGGNSCVSLRQLGIAQPVLVALVIAAMLSFNWELNSSLFALLIHMGVFCLTALMCHMRLAQLRPAGKNLTSFYLMLSVGGACGGVLNAFIAPLVLNAPVEYPAILILSLLVNPIFADARLRRGIALRNVFVALLLAMIVARMFATEGVLAQDRSFFGTLTVMEMNPDGSIGGAPQDGKIRVLSHGSTVHGVQIMSEAQEKLPGSYYTRQGPVGDVYAVYKPKHAAIIGLGVGSMNCYVPKNGSAVFIDIDPAIVKAANNYFTYLDKCSPAGRPEIIVGDGRLALGGIKKSRKFDIIALDAFTADAIPTHLLTVEAIRAYHARLNRGGVILFNISNRYVNLAPVLARNAQEAGLKALFREDRQQKPGEPRKLGLRADSTWLVITAADTGTAALAARQWRAPDTGTQMPWTDDYTNLAAALRF